jgi:Tol biopolymer transport system component
VSTTRPASVLVPVAAIALLLGAGDAQGDLTTSNGRILFASSRAASLVRPAIYTIGIDGKGRRRVSPARGGIESPLWSPTGKAIAYFRRQRLYSVDLISHRSRLLVRGNVSDPAWSPDGSRLAAYRERPDESSDLVLIPAAGGRFRTIARHIRQFEPFGSGRPAWSPNGTRLVFARAVGRRQELRIVDLATRSERLLVRTRFVDAHPAWSPDGSRLAFTRFFSWDDRRWAVVTVDLATGRPVGLADGLELPAWSPDGLHVAAMRGSGIFVVDAHGRHRIRVGFDTVDESPGRPPIWTSDSKLVIAAYRDEIYRFRADGHGRRRITRELPGRRLEWSSRGLGIVVNVSPDGRRVAYASRPYEPPDPDLYAIGADGAGLRALTRNWIDDYAPTWSPDGTSVAFVRGRRRSKIAVLRRGRVRFVALGSQPRWSPDGRRLVFVRGGDLYTVGVDGRDEQLVSRGVADESNPDWSPDGGKIVFERSTQEGSDLWVVAIDGSDLRRLTDVRAGRDRCFPANAEDPEWSPSGAEIVYVLTEYGRLSCGYRGGTSSVYVMRGDGTEARYVTKGGWADPTGDVGAVSPTWSPNGRMIAFVNQLERATDLAVVSASGGPFRLIRHTRDAQSPDWTASR